MARHMALVSMCLVLLLGEYRLPARRSSWDQRLAPGIAFPWRSPIRSSGWGRAFIGGGPRFRRLQVAEVIARVQGRPGAATVDGVPVTFEVEPGWESEYIACSIPQTSTHVVA